MFCTECGKKNPDSAKFCQNCGNRLIGVVDDGDSNIDASTPLELNKKHMPETGSKVAENYRTTPNDSPPIPKQTRMKNSLSLKEVSSLKAVAFILLLPIGVLVFDFILGAALFKVRVVVSQRTFLLIFIFYHVLFGIILANALYKFSKLFLITGLSVFVLFFYRFVIMIAFNPLLIEQSLINTLIEATAIYGPLFLFSFLFRYSETRLYFAEIQDKQEFKESGKKVIRGICSKCGGFTVDSKGRLAFLRLTFLGMSPVYFCDNCKTFIQGNPVTNIFSGIVEICFSFLFIVGTASFADRSSSVVSLLYLLFFVSIYDGFKGMFFGFRGLIRSIKGKNVKPSELGNVNGYHMLGLHYSSCGRNEEAIPAYQEAIKRYPNDAEATNNLGNAYVILGRYEEAIQAYKSAIRIDPETAIYYFNLGSAYDQIGRYEDSIKAYKNAGRIDPEDAPSFIKAGNAYEHLGLFEKAIEAYKVALLIEPNNAEAHASLGKFR